MKKRKILIIDDNYELNNNLRKFLTKTNYDVSSLYNTENLAKHINDFLPELILLDIGLPNSNGIDLCADIYAKHSIPIMFISGILDAVTIDKAMNTNALYYLPKPINRKKLLERIQFIFEMRDEFKMAA